ncbi:hypothetical protein BDW66DRAFT_163451 [Aspergillus desertorum]
MSSTTTTAATATSSCHAKLYDIPTHDAACAMPMNSTYHTLMTNCCGSASVISYSGCDYYCLAENQTVGDLAECLIKGSAAGQVWCNTNANATATGSASADSNSTASATGSETDGVSATATGDGSADATGTNAARAVGVDIKGALVLGLLVLGGIAPGIGLGFD